MLQSGMETRLILRLLDIFPRAIIILGVSEGILFVYLSTYTLSAIWSTQFLQRAEFVSLYGSQPIVHTWVFNERSIYIYMCILFLEYIPWIEYIYLIYIYLSLLCNSSILDIEHSSYYIALGSTYTHKVI